MFIKKLLIAMSAVAVLAVSGCAVTRDQQSVGEYIDDATITTQVKARFAESSDVAVTSISVETLNGVVLLSGFANSDSEKRNAEDLAERVDGVKSVKNEISVSPRRAS